MKNSLPVSSPDLFFRNIGISITTKCPVSCSHCIAGAGPERSEEVPVEELIDWIEQISRYRNGYVRMITLTGGEPFYNIARLQTISSSIQNHGLYVTVVTNAFWASSPEKAADTLRLLPSVQAISVSTDVYHQSHIPLERVTNACIAAREEGRVCTVNVCTQDTRNEQYKQILRQLQKTLKSDTIQTMITLPLGRGSDTLDPSAYPLTKRILKKPCFTINFPIILPDGRVMACCGASVGLSGAHPLVLGNIRQNSLQTILDNAARDPLIFALRTYGPGKIARIFKKKGYGNLPETYIKNCLCDICMHLLQDEQISGLLSGLQDVPGLSGKAGMSVFQESET